MLRWGTTGHHWTPFSAHRNQYSGAMPADTIPALLLDTPGAPQTLRLGRIPRPETVAGQVRIVVQACGVNPVDEVLCRTGVPQWRWPHVPGLDVVGTVDAVGAGVPTSWMGARVAVHHDLRHPGGLAAAVCVDARMVAHVPANLTAAQAATVPCPGLTAVQVVTRSAIGAGSRVLTTGSGGAVGTFVCQLAVAAGAEVDAVASSADLERLVQLGVSRVIDYHAADVAETLRKWADAGYDVVAELVTSGADTAPLLGYNRTFVTTVGRPDLSKVPPFTLSPTAIEVALGAVYECGTDQQREALGAQLGSLLNELAVGGIASPPFVEVPLADLPLLWQAKSDGAQLPKLVATI